jgi:hypothetical protein
LRDAGQVPPELRPIESYLYPLDEEVKHVLWSLDSVLSQIEQVRDFRSRKGMTLTESRLKQLEVMQQKFAALCTLVSLKYLDQPTDAVLAQMSADAKTEAMAKKFEALQAKVARDTSEADQAITQAVAKRIQAKLEAMQA